MTGTHVQPDTHVLLVRHGQSTWNADGRWQGQADPPLSELGERQAAEAAVRLADLGARVDAVWASDLERAARTAQIVGDGLRRSPIEPSVRLDTRLRERHAGPWQGLTKAEIEAQWPGHLASGLRPDGYETDDAVLARVLGVLDDLVREHPDDHVLVVTHGGVVRVLERHLGADDGGLLPNLSGRRIHTDGEAGWVVGEHVLLVDEGSVTVPGQL